MHVRRYDARFLWVGLSARRPIRPLACAISPRLRRAQYAQRITQGSGYRPGVRYALRPALFRHGLRRAQYAQRNIRSRFQQIFVSTPQKDDTCFRQAPSELQDLLQDNTRSRHTLILRDPAFPKTWLESADSHVGSS